MRCPKCGYISFDRQRSCGKCSNDLTAVAEQLQGTVGKAASPFFLGAVLGMQTPYDDEPGPALREEEEPLDLDELEADAPPADEEELDFAGAPLNEDDLEDQPLPSLGFKDIDVSDLMPPQEDEEYALTGIDFPGFYSDDTLTVDEQESTRGDFGDEAAEPPTAEDEEIFDLSSLMNFDEPPATAADKEEDLDFLELSLGDEPDELHVLNLEDDENTPAPADAPKKPASTRADIANLGLTLENDDQ